MCPDEKSNRSVLVKIHLNIGDEIVFYLNLLHQATESVNYYVQSYVRVLAGDLCLF